MPTNQDPIFLNSIDRASNYLTGASKITRVKNQQGNSTGSKEGEATQLSQNPAESKKFCSQSLSEYQDGSNEGDEQRETRRRRRGRGAVEDGTTRSTIRSFLETSHVAGARFSARSDPLRVWKVVIKYNIKQTISPLRNISLVSLVTFIMISPSIIYIIIFGVNIVLMGNTYSGIESSKYNQFCIFILFYCFALSGTCGDQMTCPSLLKLADSVIDCATVKFKYALRHAALSSGSLILCQLPCAE